MAEGLPAEVLVIIFGYMRCADLPNLRLVCKQWYNLCPACPEHKTASQHALQMLLGDVEPTKTDLAHVCLRGDELDAEWRLQLCFLQQTTPAMLRVFLTPAIALTAYSKACETGHAHVAKESLLLMQKQLGQQHVALACMLVERHGPSGEPVLNAILEQLSHRLHWPKMLIWCVQNDLYSVFFYLLQQWQCFISASALCAAFTECINQKNARIAHGIWQRFSAAHVSLSDTLTRAIISLGWILMLQRPLAEHFVVYAASCGSRTTLEYVWTQTTPFVANAAFIAALTAKRLDNAAFLLPFVIPVAFERKRADVFFVCALGSHWDMLEALLNKPNARPCISPRTQARLFRAILFHGGRETADGAKTIVHRLFAMGITPPPDAMGKLVQMARAVKEIRPAVRRLVY